MGAFRAILAVLMEEDDGHGIQQPADAQPPDADEMECVEDAVEYLVDDKPQMVRVSVCSSRSLGLLLLSCN